MLRSSCEVRKAFRVHFRDRFARLPDLPILEFWSYLADFMEAAGCEELVTECEVRDTLKQLSSTSRHNRMVCFTKCT